MAWNPPFTIVYHYYHCIPPCVYRGNATKLNYDFAKGVQQLLPFLVCGKFMQNSFRFIIKTKPPIYMKSELTAI